ncbi:uncharacterized protein LOC142982111 [Anticarsia gemmatalis]|uniref:uncharacterized protein LOC142982111 n=1 Tax=Anticarsia gemmatalis TaxID=129554 RepID=UPI003F76AB4A
MKYSIIFLLCFQVSSKDCTVDINLHDFVYLSDHLTVEECHKLFASLHFVSYDLPSTMNVAEKRVPQNIPCIKLLLKWNSGQEKWEGKRRTHMEVEHRLRQIGRNDLADWLGSAVFHNLAVDMNNSLVNASYFIVNSKSLQHKLVTDKGAKMDGQDWTTLDSILWAALIGLLGSIVIVFFRLLFLTYRRAIMSRKGGEEFIDLLSVASVESDVEETIYEYRIEKVVGDNNGEDVNDINKVKS